MLKDKIFTFFNRNIRAIGMIAAIAVVLICLIVSWITYFSHISGGLASLYKAGFIASLSIVFCSFFVYRKQIGNHPEKVFFIILLSITTLSSWSYSTNEVSWDLESHYKFALEFADIDRSYEFSEADDAIVSRSYDADENDTRDDVLEREWASGENSINFHNIHIWKNTDLLQQKNNLLDDLALEPDNDSQIAHGSIRSIYQHVASIPASFVLFVFGFLGLPFVFNFCAAKMSYAIIFSYIMFCGMRKLRSGKMIFAVLALYPTGIFLASNYSYDYWVNAWTMFAIASIVGVLQRPEHHPSIKELLKILGAFFIALGPKAIYFPLIFLCFLMPKKQFANEKQCAIFRVCTIIVTFVVICSFLIPVMSNPGGDLRGGAEVSAADQMKFILANPIEYAKTCLIFLIHFLAPDNSCNYMTNFAYLGYAPNFLWIAMLLLSVLTTLTDTKYNTHLMFNWKSRLFVIAVFFLTLILAITALYISFTPVGLNTVNGFQGRYILPILFPLLIFIGSDRLSWPTGENRRRFYNTGILLTATILNYYALWTMYISLLC